MTEAGTRLEKPMADSDPQTPPPADPAPPSPRPSKGRQWRGGFAMRRPALSPRAMAAILALLVLLAFSTWVQLRLVGVAGGQAVVVDTARYVEMAQGFQEWRSGRGPLAGDLVRTPGFPLLLLYAAESADVTIAETVLVAQRWSGTNAQGRTLITRVLEIQCALAVLVPLLIYLMVLAASRSIALAVLAAFFYFTDPVTLSFQFVLATESLSVVLLFSALAAFALLLRTRTALAALLLGLTLTTALLVKPTLSVLALILVGAALIWLFRGDTLRAALPAASLLVAATLLGPLAWASFNAVTLGHFVYSKNAAWALQNFSAKRFVRLPVEDPQLEVLQWHAQRTLDTPRERAWSPPGHFVFTRSHDQVAEELGLEAEYDFLVLMERANRMAIRAHPLPFLLTGLERARETWTQPYLQPKNKEALRRVRNERLISSMARRDGHLLFGRWTGAALLLLGALAVWRSQSEERAFLVSASLFVIAYTLMTALFDEAEVLRHALQYRVLTNTLLLWCGWVVLRSLTVSVRELVARRG